MLLNQQFILIIVDLIRCTPDHCYMDAMKAMCNQAISIANFENIPCPPNGRKIPNATNHMQNSTTGMLLAFTVLLASNSTCVHCTGACMHGKSDRRSI